MKKAVCERVVMAAVFLAISAVLFWKCRYGYAQPADEGFYLNIPYRLLQGDRLLYDEWHVIQLSSVVLAPLLKIFLMIKGSTDGVYLASRYAYTFFKILISLFVYTRLKKYNRFGAYISSIIFLIYAGYGIMGLSYNNIALGGAVVALLLMLNEHDGPVTRICWVLAGLSLSVSVLGIPVNALLYIAYIIGVIAVSRASKKRMQSGKTFNPTMSMFFSYKAFGFVTIGVAIALTAFFIYVLRDTTVMQIIQTIPYILSDDTAHQAKGLYRLTLAYLVRILIGNHHNYAVLATYMGIGGVLAAFLLDKKRNDRIIVYITAEALMCAAMLIVYAVTENYINYVVYVPNVLAVLIVVMAGNDLNRTMFASFVVSGILLTYSEYAASNTGATGIANASCVATVGSVIIIADTVKNFMGENVASDMRRLGKCAAGIICAYMAATILFLGYYRVTYTFWESGLDSLTETIQAGPAKGLKVTKERYESYNRLYEDTALIRELPDSTRVVYHADAFLWIAGTQRCGSYTPHYQRIDSLENYYEIHSDRMADVIYIEGDKDSSGIKDVFVNKYGYSCTRLSAGWLLEKGNYENSYD